MRSSKSKNEEFRESSLNRNPSAAEQQKREGTLLSVRSEGSHADASELPQLATPSAAKQEQKLRQELFRSRHFSSVAGLNNPLKEEEEGDIEKRYDLYERLRTFYRKHDAERIKKGLGNLVEWTLEHGEVELNKNLRRKYGADLDDMEKIEGQKYMNMKADEKRRRQTQIALSRRFMANKDPDTRKKMDKLTRFLLVNDPELVSRGMYLMLKFIESKGLGALNQNLKKNYGKSLDGVTEDELNAELKKKYGNDLEMLEKPLFGEENEVTDVDSVQATLKEQIQNIDKERLRQTQLEKAEETRKSRIKQQKETKPLSLDSERQAKKATKTETSRATPRVSSKRERDDRAYIETLSSKPKFLKNFMEYQDTLRQFLEKYEPYRFDNAFKLMSEFMKKNGVDELNRKLRKKYDVDLVTFQKIDVDLDGQMSNDEFQIRLMQFVNKHEASKNIEKALKAMTDYRNRHGVAALNTKLYIKYGETLNDVVLEPDAPDGITQPGLSMREIHSTVRPELRKKLESYYAKYDPMVLGSNGVQKIFNWAERNGEKALDRQLKKKYKESLSEFIETEHKLKEDLEKFYKVVDRKKVGTAQFDSVLAWAMHNGRDALNFNLRKKYDADLETVLRGSHRTSYQIDDAPEI